MALGLSLIYKSRNVELIGQMTRHCLKCIQLMQVQWLGPICCNLSKQNICQNDSIQ